MKKLKKVLLTGLMASGISGVGVIDSVQAENVREIKVLDNSNLTPMVTKIYNLQHAKAADLTPFILGAVKQMRGNSGVDRLNFKANGSQHLIVTMDAGYAESIDDLIQKLDRPGLQGTGIHHFSYSFKNRTAYGIFSNNNADRYTIADIFQDDDSTYHRFDTDTVVWKDSYSDGTGASKWFQALDIATPTAEFEITVYEVSEDDIKDLGVDYNAWQEFYKTGMFSHYFYTNTNYDNNFSGTQQPFANVNLSDFDFNIDATFLRLLQEKGKAKISSKATLVLKQHVDSAVVSKFSVFETTAQVALGSDFVISVDREKSTIFNGAEQVNLDYKVVYKTTDNDITYDCERVKIGYGDENTVFSLTRQHDVEEFVGVPFLSKIPVIKYLLGTETRSKVNVKQFITIKVKDVTPTGNTSDKAQTIINDVVVNVK